MKTVKPVLSGLSKRVYKIGFHSQLSLNTGQNYCRMLQKSILQHVRPALSYHLSLRPVFCLCLFLSGRLRQVLLYMFEALPGLLGNMGKWYLFQGKREQRPNIEGIKTTFGNREHKKNRFLGNRRTSHFISGEQDTRYPVRASSISLLTELQINMLIKIFSTYC